MSTDGSSRLEFGSLEVWEFGSSVVREFGSSEVLEEEVDFYWCHSSVARWSREHDIYCYMVIYGYMVIWLYGYMVISHGFPTFSTSFPPLFPLVVHCSLFTGGTVVACVITTITKCRLLLLLLDVEFLIRVPQSWLLGGLLRIFFLVIYCFPSHVLWV